MYVCKTLKNQKHNEVQTCRYNKQILKKMGLLPQSTVLKHLVKSETVKKEMQWWAMDMGG